MHVIYIAIPVIINIIVRDLVSIDPYIIFQVLVRVPDTGIHNRHDDV